MLSFIFTSVRSSSSSLIVAGCSPQCELGLGSLPPSLPGLRNYREATFGAEQTALILKRFKTKPKETRPAACERNVLGTLKPSFTSAAKPLSSPSLACAVPVAGVTWPSERCRCPVGFAGYQRAAFDEAQLGKQLSLWSTQPRRKLSMQLVLPVLMATSCSPEGRGRSLPTRGARGGGG